MARSLLVRGMLAGLAAGLLALVVAYFLGEPNVDSAISFEATHSHEHEMEIVSRSLQSTAGLATGVLIYGVAFGGIAGLAFCFALGRVGRFSPRATALLLSGCALLAVYVVPFLKYPANPPSVGNPDTIGERGGLYLVMVVGSVLAALVALWVGRRLSGRLGTWNAALAGLLCFAVLVGLLMAVLPSLGQLRLNVEQYGSLPTETPRPLRDPSGAIVLPGFDADLLYQFRLYSVCAQALLWGVLGVAFAPLAERVLGSADRRMPVVQDSTA